MATPQILRHLIKDLFIYLFFPPACYLLNLKRSDCSRLKMNEIILNFIFLYQLAHFVNSIFHLFSFTEYLILIPVHLALDHAKSIFYVSASRLYSTCKINYHLLHEDIHLN